MPFSFSGWFGQHYYITLLIATFIEGLGIPLPAEVLFLAAAGLVHRHQATLPAIVLVASLGSVAGTMTGFGLAYYGGARLIRRTAEVLGFNISPEAAAKSRDFVHRHGPKAFFLSRFIGFIRAATIYSAGAARVSPVRFGAYILAAALIWNTAWANLAFHFGVGLRRLLHGEQFGAGAIVAVVVLLLVILIPLGLRLYRRRRTPTE